MWFTWIRARVHGDGRLVTRSQVLTMSYKPINEILAELEAQQRRELATLSNAVDPARIDRKRRAKKQLSAVAVFFIERSWEVFAPTLETFSLEAEAKKSPEELRAYLNSLCGQQSAYAWGWVRARMNAPPDAVSRSVCSRSAPAAPGDGGALSEEPAAGRCLLVSRESAASPQSWLPYRAGSRLQMVRLGFRVVDRDARLLPARRSPPLCGTATLRIVLHDHAGPNRRLSLGLGRREPHGCRAGRQNA